jgi:predicted amidophosphoribosyltransferase
MTAPGAAAGPAAVFCSGCGAALSGPDAHPGCVERLRYEPPRYCDRCGRRMVVQVLPTGWRARCSAHGERRN